MLTNISALHTLNRVHQNNKPLSRSLEKLSSGLRIFRAADDAAGLAISERMRFHIRGLAQAGRNIQDGISLLQTADSSLGMIQEPNLIRLRELAMQASNGTLSDQDRKLLQKEAEHVKQGINDIANQTNFNGIHLLNVAGGAYSYVTEAGKNIMPINSSMLIGNSSNIHNVKGIEIIADVNDELTVKFDGSSYSIRIAEGVYKGSSEPLYDDINSKLAALGAPVKITDVHAKWDDTHMRIALVSTMPGDHAIEVEGMAFNEIFTEESASFGKHKVWGREADFSVGYTVVKGVNDTLNFRDNGIDKTIVLTEGSYSRDELIHELNAQFAKVNADIKASISSVPIGVNVSTGPGNKHYILELKHNTSNSDNAIQLISGNALNPLFIRSVQPGDVWTPKSTSYLKTDIDISNGLTIKDGQQEWEFTVDGSITKKISLPPGTYTSKDLIDAINVELEKISAGITAVNDNDVLKFEREMNGSSYTITDFTIASDSALQLQVGPHTNDTYAIQLVDATTSALGLDSIDLSTAKGAAEALSVIDRALLLVTSHRTKFGAHQNALERIHNNNTNYAVNLSYAESRIRDANMAKEMMNYTKAIIISQASQSMLSQANAQSKVVLDLIQVKS